MFHPAPRRHRRLPTGTMVSYAEVKSYLSKREIPQLFESLMAGLMYHRPENHIGYLQTCLDEVKTNSETKVQWSTFVNAKKRKSKEILPPLTPKKQDSYSSSWSDNSRQSTPLPPISARTRTRLSLEQQDFRNTYILYHNPPPVLAKPKVPVISVLGGLGTKIDELCERVVGRLRGVVHISTCSMLKTRMTIEGFYRITAVPACAVVDSVLQAMSMVQSASALLVAGFPRSRGDIEEYRSRRVRMDGVILVDFEEEALRRFLEYEVESGCVRSSEIEAELERFKQDIISVAEYYDQKELLTVVMGDQDLEEIIDDLVMAVDKVIETRKNVVDEDTTDIKKDRECDSPCKALIPSPDRIERPSTVEIREATEEDIKSIEAEAKKANGEDLEIIDMDKDGKNETDAQGSSEEGKQDNAENELDGEKIVTTNEEENSASEINRGNNTTENCEPTKLAENMATDTEQVSEPPETENDGKDGNSEANDNEKAENLDSNQENNEDDDLKENKEALERNTVEAINIKTQSIPLIFSFENINADYDEIKNLIANDLEMCFIDFQELMRNDGSEEDKFDNDEALSILRGILKQDSVSYSNGFFIFKYPFSLVNDNIVSELLKLGDLSFVCQVREKKQDSESESEYPEKKLFNSSLSEQLKIIFVTEGNIIHELRQSLQDIIENGNKEKEMVSEDIIQIEGDGKQIEDEIKLEDVEKENDSGEAKLTDKDENKNVILENEEIVEEKTNRDEYEDSTGKDVEDLISDDTLNEGSKPPESLKSEEDQEVVPDEIGVDDTHSQASSLASAADDTQKERAVLERQPGIEIPTDNATGDSNEEDADKIKLTRQTTYTADEGINEVAEEEVDQENNEESKPNEELDNEQPEKIESNEEAQPPPESDKEIIENTTDHIKEQIKSWAAKSNSNEEVDEKEDNGEVNNKNEDEPQSQNEEHESELELQPASEAVQNEDGEEMENEDNKSKVIEENTDNAVQMSEEIVEEHIEKEDGNLETDVEKQPSEDNAAEINLDNKETEDNECNSDEIKNEEDTPEHPKDEVEMDDVTCNADEEDSSEKGDKSEQLEKTEDDTNEEKAEQHINDSNENPENELSDNKNDEETNQENDTEKISDENNEILEKESEQNVIENTENDNENLDEATAEPEKLDISGTEHEVDSKETHNSEKIQKVLDDSDSNDENVTIETHAEVHATDCESPAAEEPENAKNEETDANQTEATENLNSEKESDEDGNKVKTGNGEQEETETPVTNEEDDKNEEVDNKQNENEPENITKETLLENIDESDGLTIESVGTERYSNKRQERNGSGILDESRESNQMESEEPQERSSSSSRGEL